MRGEVTSLSRRFLEESKNKSIRIIAYPNTEGIICSSILAKTFKKLNRKFSIRFSKKINQEISKENSENLLVLIDSKLESPNKRENALIITGNDIHSISAITYLFSKEILNEDIDISGLAVIGMIAEQMESNLSSIKLDSKNLEIRKGVSIYPATRPLKRTLQFSTSPYIPGVTGNEPGVMELLEEIKIDGEKSLLDLDENEMSKLSAAIRLRQKGREALQKNIGEIYILKMFNKKEDAREIANILNACSKQGYPDVALSYCLGDKNAKSRALDLYTKHTLEVVSGLRVAENLEKIDNGSMVILNARDKIRDIIVGTICSMLSKSPEYKEGTILIGMAYNQDKIKVSARIVGKTEKNLKEFLKKTVINLKNDNSATEIEVDGHELAAGCLLDRNKEKEFIEALKRNSEIEVMRV